MRAVVVAQLADWLLPTAEVPSSIRVNGKILKNVYLLSTVFKRRNGEKEDEEGPFYENVNFGIQIKFSRDSVSVLWGEIK